MRLIFSSFILATAIVSGGCDKISPINRTPSISGLGGAGGGAGSGSGGSGSGGTSGQGGSVAAGLPCEVQTILVKYCASCHGAPPSGGAPRSLVTYADLTKNDLTNSSQTEAQAALQRMQSKSSPMPPSSPTPSTAEIATIQNWVSSGYPTGTCGVTAAGGTTGSSGGSGGSGSSQGGSGGSAGSSQTGSGGSGGSSQAGSGGSSGASGGGLPCDIQTFLVSTCQSCHGATPSGGAPRSLVTYADLTMKDPANTSMTEAQVALQRMQNSASPMPPSPTPKATSAQITMLQNWISSGYPTGSCASGGSGGSGSGSGGTGGTAGGGGSSGAGGTSQVGAGGTSGIADAGVPGGTLPCDVQTLMVNRCTSCHGTTPSGGAPRSLVTYANLTSPDPSNTAMTEAQVALQRMQNTASPMPPSPATAATSTEIATLQNWINGGYPSGSCSGDAGVPPTDPLNAPPTCTSKTNWTQGTNGSSSMEPGQACIKCHSSNSDAPKYVIAGTLYPTGHEPDNCNGVNGTTAGAKVVVTGNNGTSVSLTPNSAGNFYSSTTLPPPYKAKVVNSTGVERVMSGTAANGDCNSCHTQNGASSAPGRITLP